MAKRPSGETSLSSSSDEDDHSIHSDSEGNPDGRSCDGDEHQENPNDGNDDDKKNSVYESVLLVKPIRSKRMKKCGTNSEDVVSAIKKKKNKSEKETKKMQLPTASPLSSSSRKVWTNEEGIFILKGLIEFKEKHCHTPSNSGEYDALLDLVKKTISCDFTRLQLSDKVRKLKMKFLEKRKNRGGVITDYEKDVLDLGTKIWEEENGDDGSEDGGKDKEEAPLANVVKDDAADSETLKKTKSSRSANNNKKKTTSVANVAVVTPKIPPFPSSPSVADDESGGFGILMDVVKKFDNEISGGPNLRPFERAMHMMTHARQKAWEDELKKQSVAEIEVYKKLKALENKLIEELHDILKKDAVSS